MTLLRPAIGRGEITTVETLPTTTFVPAETPFPGTEMLAVAVAPSERVYQAASETLEGLLHFLSEMIFRGVAVGTTGHLVVVAGAPMTTVRIIVPAVARLAAIARAGIESRLEMTGKMIDSTVLA